MRKQIETISLIGMGALGIMYGQHFAKALGREAVRFVADEKRQARYAEKGITCNGEPCDFRMVTPQETGDSADLLIFAVKGTGLEQAIADAKNQVGPDTIVLSVMNGISSEEALMEAYGRDKVIYCVALGMDAVKIGDGLVVDHMGKIVFGVPEEQAEKQPLADAVKELCERTALPYVAADDIMHRLWNKFMINVGVNQTVMICEGTYRDIQEPTKERETMIAAMREVMALAEREGILLMEEDLKSSLDLLGTLSPDGMPSMRQDGLLKRPSEVELFAGPVRRLAAKHGLAVPVNDAFYACIKEREKEYGCFENCGSGG